MTKKQNAVRKYNRESQPSLDNQGYFSEKVTFSLRFTVWVGTGRVGAIPGSKNKLQRSLRQEKTM